MSLLEAAARFEANPNRKTLDGRVIATLFFEPSTRTRLSFERRILPPTRTPTPASALRRR